MLLSHIAGAAYVTWVFLIKLGKAFSLYIQPNEWLRIMSKRFNFVSFQGVLNETFGRKLISRIHLPAWNKGTSIAYTKLWEVCGRKKQLKIHT